MPRLAISTMQDEYRDRPFGRRDGGPMPDDSDLHLRKASGGRKGKRKRKRGSKTRY